MPIRFVTDDAGPLIERLAAEGANSPADILLTVDAGELWHAADRGLLQPVDSPVLSKHIPAPLRDPENRWFGLSVRARTIVYSTERVKPEELEHVRGASRPAVARASCACALRRRSTTSRSSPCSLPQHGEEQTENIVRGLGGESRDRCVLERHLADGVDCRRSMRCRHRQHVLLRSAAARQAVDSGQTVLGGSRTATACMSTFPALESPRMRRIARKRRNFSSGCRQTKANPCLPG